MALAAVSALIVVAVEAATLAGVPVPPGLAMLLLAPCILHVGAHRAATLFGRRAGGGSSSSASGGPDVVSQSDAMAMPLVAGGALLGLYVAFKYFDMAAVNAVLLVYFVVVGVGCCAALAYPSSARLLAGPASSSAPGGGGGEGGDDDEGADPAPGPTIFTVPSVPYLLPEPLEVTRPLVLATAVGSLVPAAYALTRHWAANNALGAAFCVEALASLDLGDFSTGITMLGGLFVYDIFMVFGTKKLMRGGGPSVMETVATSVDGPIKLAFPLPPSQAVGKARPYSLLGLGDIIVPGLFLVLLLRFDAERARAKTAAKAAALAPHAKGPKAADAGGGGLQRGAKAGEDAAAAAAAAAAAPAPPTSTDARAALPFPPAGSYPTPYFSAGFFAYVAGLCATLAALHWSSTAQPALLYLCPACGLLPILLALVRGEAAELLGFSTGAREEKEKRDREEGAAEAALEDKKER